MISVKNSFEIAYNGTENECRFELYADTAADLQSLTHIDGIKIQMGSECTDISTGDKYLLNGSGVWILQPSDNAWQNVYTKPEIDSMITEIYDIIAYYHTTLVSDTGEITFYALAGYIATWKIYGNGQQTGTPTPDNPIQPEFVGVRTGNLYFKKIAGANISDNGTITALTGFDLYIAKVEQGVRYSGNGYIYAFFEDEPVIGSISFNGSRVVGSFNNIVSPISGFVAARLPSTAQNIMCNTGLSVLPYEPYGWKIPITCAGQTTPLYLGEVSTVRRIKKMILDGTETVTEESANVYSIPISDTVIAGAGVSTHFAYDASTADGQFQIESGKAVFGYDDTLENFKAFLAAQYAAGHPVTIWYVIAEPETAIVNEPLAKIGDYADELHSTDAGVTIPTVKGQNTLTVDTELQPSLIEISGGYHA